MTVLIEAQPLPLTVDTDNVVRVGATRVTLDTLVAAFSEGATPEEMAFQYPSLGLSDIYAVISYYLQHRAEVDAYLAAWNAEASKQRLRNEARFDPAGVRARLLARRGRMQS